MNNHRRREVAKLEHRLELLSLHFEKDFLYTCISMLEDIKNDEEDAFFNMPENLQGSMRGMESEEAIDSLEEAIEYLEDLIDVEDDEEREENIMMAISCLEDIC